MKRLIIMLGLMILLGGCQSNSQNPVGVRQTIRVGSTQVAVEVRDTEAGRELGLSYRQSMAIDEGVLFVFPEPARYGFWMKGMVFPLDMVWIREGRVVDISEQVPAPQTAGEQPTTVVPKEPVDQVLEVNAGWVARQGVKVGDVVIDK